MVLKPLRFMRGGVERLLSSKSERGLREGKEKLFSGARSGESPRGQKAQESKGLRPELTLRGARVEGSGFFSGRKSLERRCKVRQGFVGKRRSGREIRKGSFDHWKGARL